MWHRVGLAIAGAALVYASGISSQSVDATGLKAGDGTVVVQSAPIPHAFWLRMIGIAAIAGAATNPRQGKPMTGVMEAVQERGPIMSRGYDADDFGVKVERSAPTEKVKTVELGAVEMLQAYTGHLMLACRTQSGKTSLLLGVMDAWKRMTSTVPFIIVDPKNSHWGGLEGATWKDTGLSQVVDLRINEPASIFKLVDTLELLGQVRQKRSDRRLELRKQGKEANPEPVFLLVDEWITVMKIAEFYDGEKEKDEPSVVARIKKMIEILIFTGAEDKVFVWLVGQSHFSNQNKLDTGVRNNMAIWAQGRDGEVSSIEAVIGDNNIVRPADRDGLTAELKKNLATAGPLPIYYSNLRGHRIGMVPDLGNIKQVTLSEGAVEENETSDPW